MPFALRWVGRVLRRQSVKPPRQTRPLNENKFCRWSEGLNAWLPHSSSARIPYCVALEGCGSAFNALNAMRTSLFFGTCQPPVLLNVRGWQDINQLRQRQGNAGSEPSKVNRSVKSVDEDPEEMNDDAEEEEEEGKKRNKLQGKSSSQGPSSSNSSTTTSSDSDPSSIKDSEGSGGSEVEMPPILLFGDDAFLSKEHAQKGITELPIVAVENYVPGAKSIHRTRFPSDGCRLVMGHENTGVSQRFLMMMPPKDIEHRNNENNDNDNNTINNNNNNNNNSDDTEIDSKGDGSTCATQIIFVPQFGTISSLNVVTSMGIALFYAFLDARYPTHRTIVPDTPEKDQKKTPPSNSSSSPLPPSMSPYQKSFTEALPTISEVGSTKSPSESTSQESECAAKILKPTPVSAWTASGRVDKRPIHPVYYGRDVDEIKTLHRKHHDSLLRQSDSKYVRCKISGSTFEKTYTPRFGLSVLYSTDEDGRNFGGLVRNSNAFLVDEVLYYGKRRKVNVVGAVGSQHYTPVVYLGDPGDDDGEGELEEVTGGGVIEPYPSIPEEEYLRYVGAALRAEVTRNMGASPEWWLLDCGQLRSHSDAVSQSTHLLASWEWLCAHQGTQSPPSSSSLSLCDDEETLRRATQPNGVLLVIPPEGSLPHVGVLSQCTRVLRITPEKDAEENTYARGLPSPVASGIALERLSAIMHPKLRS